MTLDDFLAEQHRAGVAKLRAKKPRVAKQAAPAPLERDGRKAMVSFLRKAGCITSSNINELRADSKDPHQRARFWAAMVGLGSTKAFPDLTAITARGVIFLVECKRTSKHRPTEPQLDMHAKLRERGIPTIVAWDVWSLQDGLRAAGVSLER